MNAADKRMASWLIATTVLAGLVLFSLGPGEGGDVAQGFASAVGLWAVLLAGTIWLRCGGKAARWLVLGLYLPLPAALVYMTWALLMMMVDDLPVPEVAALFQLVVNLVMAAVVVGLWVQLLLFTIRSLRKGAA